MGGWERGEVKGREGKVGVNRRAVGSTLGAIRCPIKLWMASHRVLVPRSLTHLLPVIFFNKLKNKLCNKLNYICFLHIF
jgi:hypothetical protein